ncbi:polyprenyl synthetase [Streptomyces anulatus]
MTREAGRDEGLDERVVLLVAGAADLAVSAVGSALGAVGSTLGAVRGLLRRSDAAELAAEAEHELTARGRLVLDRYAAPPPAHLELLARHVVARRASDDA